MKPDEKRRVLVIGGGFGGMAAAALLARDGMDVTVLERNDQAGGRARTWEKDGFTFDMGPSWYLMPEVFERFFGLFGEKREDWYTLKRLDPSYRVLYGPGDAKDVSSNPGSVAALFDSFEPGAGARLKSYLADAEYKYRIAMKEFLYREYRSIFDFFSRRMMVEGLRLKVLGNLDVEVSRLFKDRRARQILEYAMVFLGTAPKDAPGLYSIMSHVDLTQGVFYPMGGLASVAQAVQRLAMAQGVKFELSTEVEAILVKDGRATGVQVRRLSPGGSLSPDDSLSPEGKSAGKGHAKGDSFVMEADVVLANADYAHVETRLLPPEARSYPASYWKKRVVAPSMFVMYLGLSKSLPKLLHHNLYFQEDWDGHFDTIFRKPSWPERPCFYVSCISKTDPGMAPAGGENVFLLIPVAAGLDDTDEIREKFADEAIEHLEHVSGEAIRQYISIKRIFSQRDFAGDYNAWLGTALGLSHTLGQTAVFRPSMRSRKVGNLFFTGQYTHPGIGVPMVLIAAELAAGIIGKD